MTAAQERLSNLVGASWRVLRADGPQALWFQFLSWTGIYRRMAVGSGSFSNNREPAALDFELDELTLDAVDSYVRFRPLADVDDIRRRLLEGQRCSTARLPSGELAAVVWASYGRVHIEFVDCDIELEDHVAFTYDIFVAEQHRGIGLGRALENDRDTRHQARGISHWVAVYWSANHVSLRRAGKLGHHLVGTLSLCRIFGWRRHRLEMFPSRHSPLFRLIDRAH